MKKLLFFILLITLAFTGCENPNMSDPSNAGNNDPVTEDPGSDDNPTTIPIELTVGKYRGVHEDPDVEFSIEFTETQYFIYLNRILYKVGSFSDSEEYTHTDLCFSTTVTIDDEAPFSVEITKAEEADCYKLHAASHYEDWPPIDMKINKVDDWYVYNNFVNIETVFEHEKVKYIFTKLDNRPEPESYQFILNLYLDNQLVETKTTNDSNTEFIFDNLTSDDMYKVTINYQDLNKSETIEIYDESFEVKKDIKHEITFCRVMTTESDARLYYLTNSEKVLESNLETKILWSLKETGENTFIVKDCECTINEDDNWFRISDLSPNTSYTIYVKTKNGDDAYDLYFTTRDADDSVTSYMDCWTLSSVNTKSGTVNVDGKTYNEGSFSFENFGNKTVKLYTIRLAGARSFKECAHILLKNNNENVPFLTIKPGESIEESFIIKENENLIFEPGNNLDDELNWKFDFYNSKIELD